MKSITKNFKILIFITGFFYLSIVSGKHLKYDNDKTIESNLKVQDAKSTAQEKLSAQIKLDNPMKEINVKKSQTELRKVNIYLKIRL
jgi:hypothetical protein